MKRFLAPLLALALLAGCAGFQPTTSTQQLVISGSKLATVAYLSKNPSSTARMDTLLTQLEDSVTTGAVVTVEQAVAVVDLYLSEAKLEPMTRLALTELTATAVAEVLNQLKAVPAAEQIEAYKPALLTVIVSMRAGLAYWKATPEWAKWKAAHP